MANHNTVFAQLLKFVPRHEFESLANQHHSGRKLRKMTRWTQFVSMAAAQLSGRSSLQMILRFLQLDLFERRDLLELLRGDPPETRISPNQTALVFS